MRKKSFHCVARPDSARVFAGALTNAGYTETKKAHAADFLVCDHEPSAQAKYDKMKEIFKGKPIFFIPHTPYSAFFFWDGLFEPWQIQCNFVVAEGAKIALERIGYPNRAEIVGFYPCEIRSFAPTHGRDLLFAPAHPLRVNGKYPRAGDLELHKSAMRWIIENRKHFDRVVVRYGYKFEDNGLEEFSNADVEFVQAEELSASSAIRFMQPFAFVISCATFGYLSLAQGKPTVLYGYDSGKNSIPHNARGFAKNHQLYWEILKWPFPLESLGVEQVLEMQNCEPQEVLQWKRMNIGSSFRPEKFISVVREYV